MAEVLENSHHRPLWMGIDGHREGELEDSLAPSDSSSQPRRVRLQWPDGLRRLTGSCRSFVRLIRFGALTARQWLPTARHGLKVVQLLTILDRISTAGERWGAGMVPGNPWSHPAIHGDT